jgi:hypothetical protein
LLLLHGQLLRPTWSWHLRDAILLVSELLPSFGYAADKAACEVEIVESSPKLVAAVAATTPLRAVQRVILAMMSSAVMHILSRKLSRSAWHQ